MREEGERSDIIRKESYVFLLILRSERENIYFFLIYMCVCIQFKIYIPYVYIYDN